jgi:hypothetical protein
MTDWSPHQDCRPYRLMGIATVAALTFTMIGCNSAIETYPVTVRLTFPDGSSPEGTVVVFHPVPDGSSSDGNKSTSAIGKVGPDGTAQLSTFQQADGAIAGKHRVTIAPSIHAAMETGVKSRAATIDPRYRKVDTTPIELNVDPDGPNEFDIALKQF